MKWKISFTVQVYDEKNCYVDGPGERTPYAIGHRVEVYVNGETHEKALAKLGNFLTGSLAGSAELPSEEHPK